MNPPPHSAKTVTYEGVRFKRVPLPRVRTSLDDYAEAVERLQKSVERDDGKRRCSVCGEDISHTHGRRKTCQRCQNQKDGRVCMDCGRKVKSYFRRCDKCKKKRKAEANRRWYADNRDYFQKRSKK